MERPLVILVHGAWHGAWCWAGLQAELDRRGLPSLAVELPGHGASTAALTDLYGDAHHVADVVNHVGRPAVLVGHSYGGAVITEAIAETASVRAAVFVAAFALAEGETVRGTAVSVDRHVALNDAIRPLDADVLAIDPTLAVPAFYGSCPPAAAAAAVQRLGPQPAVTFIQPARSDAWRAVPSTYVLCRRDEAIHPDVQVLMAARCDTVVELDTDHSPFLSAVASTADAVQAAFDRIA